MGLNQESKEELDYVFGEMEYTGSPREFILENMAPVRQAAVGPMLAGRELEELGWEPIAPDDPRLTAHPDWLKKFREFAATGRDSLTYQREVVEADAFTTCGGDGGCNICGGLGSFIGFLPCSPHYKPEVHEDGVLDGDYDFYRPMIRVEPE